MIEKMNSYFGLTERGSTIKTELLAGVTTFLTMSYILAVNPSMLGSVMSAGGVFTATVLASIVAMIIMAFYAKLPIALAPGMGINAFFTYTVCIGMGVPYQYALAAVFISGIIMVILTFFMIRTQIIISIPPVIRQAIGVGIGFFIALIGLVNAGIIVGNPVTLVSLGDIKSGSALLAVIGIIITFALYTNKIPAAIILGVLITTIIGVPFGVTVIPENFAAISLPAAPLFFHFDFTFIFTWQFFIVVLTFLITDIFDTAGTLMAVLTEGKMVNPDGTYPKMKEAFVSDGLGTVVGACLGTSTITSYVESGSGVAQGGRTGLTSLTTAGLFFIALFLSPLFLLVPAAATAPALIIVGYLMLQGIFEIDIKDTKIGLPAFVTIFMTVFTYSITEGIIYGLLSWVIVKIANREFKEIPVGTWVLFGVFVLKIIFM